MAGRKANRISAVGLVDSAITTALQGFINSIFRLAHVSVVRITPISVVEQSKLRSHLEQKIGAIQHLAIDATGLKVSGDGAYETRACHDAIKIKRVVALIPPREEAAFWECGHPRNFAVVCQKSYDSNNYWKERYGYHKRLLSETAMYRVKQLLEDS